MFLFLGVWGCEPIGTTFDSRALSYDATKATRFTIRDENAKLGDAGWQLADPASNHEIEGYASATSVNGGDDIGLFVNTIDASYTIEIYRVGWYGGAGGRRVHGPVIQPGIVQPPPAVDRRTRMVECNWINPYVVHTAAVDGKEWVSGVYVAKLTGSGSGKQSYIVFVVRDDERASDLLFQTSVTTYQAYNMWGGYSLYSKPRATHVSFNRPYAQASGWADFGAWELRMLYFLEREGYDVTYSTDIDTHRRGELLTMHKGFLSVGHDEYWSWRMRDNVERARNNGVSLGFFGANVSYFQIRLEASRVTGAADRTIVCYKDWDRDPVRNSSDPEVARRITTRFRNFRVGRPEDAMVGIMYEHSPVHGDIVVENTSHWVFAGTGLHDGDRLTGLLGYEVDRMYGNAALGTQRIGHSPYHVRDETRFGDMSVFSADGSPTIFATGSMNWNLGLSEPVVTDKQQTVPVSVQAQQITRNVLRHFGAEPNL